ncbi:MAG: polysaccharide deacetylase family protein [Verrucomicrobia bacterium]|nr:polysaccharide deacetylase family protein [Deltaproteobacteria bacterium]
MLICLQQHSKAVALFFALVLFTALPAESADPLEVLLADLKLQITHEYAGRIPHEWAETVPGVRTRLKTGDKVLALTLDACGSATGKGYDAVLINFLEREQIPATLFVNARWIDANPDIFRKLARNPLFEIANHGLLHRPASITGRSVYGINGTGNVAGLVDEIEGNARKISALTGKRPQYYRSGTAYYDEVAVEVSRRLRHDVIGFSILGDAGATFRAEQVKSALLKAVPGDIALLHMNHPDGQTAAGVIAAVPELKRRGFRFVKLSDYSLE